MESRNDRHVMRTGKEGVERRGCFITDNVRMFSNVLSPLLLRCFAQNSVSGALARWRPASWHTCAEPCGDASGLSPGTDLSASDMVGARQAVTQAAPAALSR